MAVVANELREKADKWIAIVRIWAEIARMSANAVKLQVRMDRSLKEEAEEVFAEMGLDTTTAVRIFFTKVARTRSIPFQLKAEREFTPEQEARILEAWEESKDPANLSGPFATVEELFEHLDDAVAKDGQTEKLAVMGE
jgi:DNA-damage-inducible protein J